MAVEGTTKYKKRKIKGKEVIDLVLNKKLLSDNDMKDIRIISEDILDKINNYDLNYLKKLDGDEIILILLKKEILKYAGLNDEDLEKITDDEAIKILSGKEKIYLEGEENPKTLKRIDDKEIKVILKDKLRSDSKSKIKQSLNESNEVILVSKKNKIVNIKNNLSNIIFELNIYKIDTEELLETAYIKAIEENNKSIFIYEDRIVFNPGIHLRNLGYSDGYYKIKYNFYRNLFGTNESNLMFITEISPSRKELVISVIPDSVNSTTNKISERSENSVRYSNMVRIFNSINYNELSHFINFGDSVRHLVVNSQFNNNKMYIKLHQPLNEDLGIKSPFWLNYEQLPEYEDKIMLFTEQPEDESGLFYLRPPEFDYRQVSVDNVITGFVSFDDLTSTSPTNRNDILYSIFSQSLIEGIPLNIEYRDFSDFIYYSSAKKRLENFHYKIRQIETYQNNINNLSILSGSGYTSPWIGSEFVSSSVSSSIRAYETNIDDVVNKFDGFERYMYFESSSYESSSYGIFPSICWPKSNTTKPYIRYSYSSSEAINWYTEMLTSASLYDRQNPHKLQNYIPIEIQNDELNYRYTNLINQSGHQLDINYNYIKHMTKLNEYENSVSKGIPSDLLAERLVHFGMPIHSGYSIIDLPDFILTTGSDSTFSVSGSDVHN